MTVSKEEFAALGKILGPIIVAEHTRLAAQPRLAGRRMAEVYSVAVQRVLQESRCGLSVLREAIAAAEAGAAGAGDQAGEG